MPYKMRTRGTPPYIVLGNSIARRVGRKPPKLCPDCKETNDFVKLLLSKISRIEEIVDNFHRDHYDPSPMEVDDPFDYAFYYSSDWDPMDLD